MASRETRLRGVAAVSDDSAAHKRAGRTFHRDLDYCKLTCGLYVPAVHSVIAVYPVSSAGA